MTMGKDKLRELLAVAIKHSAAEQTEARILCDNWALTRFANSGIHQNMAGQDAQLRVRAVFGKKVASGSTNRIDEQGVRTLVDDVVSMARLQDENPDFVSLPEPSSQARQGEAYSPATADSSPEERAQMVRRIADESDRVGGTAAGSLSVRGYEFAAANSLGIDSYYRSTFANLVTVVTHPEGGFGYASAEAADLADVDASSIGSQAAERAHASRNPSPIEPGDYQCVFLPYAVCNMARWLVWTGFEAMAVQEERSFVCGKLGQRIFGDRITMWDDGLDPRTIVAPFDGEGVAKQRVDIVKAGVVNAILYDSYTAHREGKKSTGHADGPGIGNLIVAPGDASVEDMIAATSRGLLVTRFHYTNMVHRMTATLTGMTRDGTFLIENGRIVGPVRNLRITQSLLEAFSNVEMVGRDQKLYYGVLAPAIKVSKFHFPSATDF